MTSAQVKAWLAVNRGAFDDVSDVISKEPSDETRADIALAQMMLHRRRAAVSQVVYEFGDPQSGSSTPYLENRAPRAPESVASELANSKAAGEMAASIGGTAPPLLFERALLAEMKGEYPSAVADLDALLDTFPGFLAAAVAYARLALKGGDPERAIRSLAYVESELLSTRVGSGLLADALHAVGMHHVASRYAVAALVGPGDFDSRGNDCAPVDMRGDVAIDARMPPAFIVSTPADNRLLCNDRGVYYQSQSAIAGSLAVLAGRRYWPLDSLRKVAARRRPFRQQVASEFVRSLLRKLSRFYFGRSRPLSDVFVARVREDTDGAKNDGTWQLYRFKAYLDAAGGWMLRIAAHPKTRDLLRCLDRALPEAIRHRIHVNILRPLRRQLASSLQKIPEQNRRSEIARERLRLGLERIFQVQTMAHATSSEPVKTCDINDDSDVAARYSRERADNGAIVPTTLQLEKILDSGAFPPPAVKILRLLLQEEISSPRSESRLAD
jgi:hypothetical protein